MSSELVFTPTCTKCGKGMGAMSEDELAVVILSDGDSVLCFDCDPESASTTPSLFWKWQESDLFTLGDVVLQVYGNYMQVIGASHAHAHERTHARGLSSYTYLNRNLHNHALLGDGVEVKACGRCHGEGFINTFYGLVPCDDCQGVGVVEVAIMLPHWILGLGCENV